MNSRLDTLQAAILQVKFKAFIDYELTISTKQQPNIPTVKRNSGNTGYP